MVTVPGYQIERLLNWGSQGDVFLASDGSGRQVALKIVTAERCDGDVQAVERLRREARLLAAIRSQHVVAVHGLIESEEWSCLALEYLQGQTLDEAVRERSGMGAATRSAMASTVKLPAPPAATEVLPPAGVPSAMQTADYVAWALGLLVQFARGVAELHAIRLLHRDLKPQNAMVVDGRVVLIDFGFARMDGITTLTQSGAAIGTLAFMSPEQFRGGQPTLQSDVYGLGAVMCFCLTGSAPVGARAHSLAEFAKRRRPPAIRRQNPAVPADLATVVGRALEPDPRDRYRDAGELLEDLLHCQRGEPVRVPFRWGRVWRHHRRHATAVAAVAAVALLAVFVFAGFDPDRAAGRMLNTVRTDRAAAQAAWTGCDDRQRDLLIGALNRRLGGDVDKAMALATTLQLGLLRLDGRANHAGVLLPTSGVLAPLPPALADFLPLDEPRCLLVRPGRAWCFVMSRDPLGWWGPDDPFCLQMLLDVPVPEGDVVERSLAVLRATLPGRLARRMVRIDVGNYPMRTAQGKQASLPIDRPFLVDVYEASGADLAMFRTTMAGQLGARAGLDRWIRHPDEPPAVADSLWRSWAGAKLGDAQNRVPARMTFWEAHRFATYFGCRLPAYAEWVVASRNDVNSLGSHEQRRIPDGDAVQPVDADPAWDRTKRGLLFTNSNVAEWTLTATKGPVAPLFAAVPSRVKFEGVRTWNPLVGIIDKTDPGEAHGVRLYRTLLQVP